MKMKNGDVKIGKVEYVNKTRECFNHIAVRIKGTKQVENIDLENDIDGWEYCKKNSEESSDEVSDDELNLTGYVDVYNGDIVETFARMIPRSMHKEEKVVEAKKVEIKKLHDFGALELVKENDQSNILPTKWVVTEIENDDKGTKKDKYKARLVIRGDLEEDVEGIRRDLPTILKHSLRMMLHLARQFD